MTRGRKPVGVKFDTVPKDTEIENILNRHKWVWIEGRVFVDENDEEGQLAVDHVRERLKYLGLVLHEQDGTEPEWAPLRRQWTLKRMPLETAAWILEQHPKGITIQEYANALFKEKDWTQLHHEAAIQKTYVIIHKLKKMGLAARNPKSLIFPTRTKNKIDVPPIYLSVVKNHLAEIGEDWPEATVLRLIQLVIQVSKSVREPPKK